MIRDTASPELQAAAPEWAPVAGELIYLTMGTVADYLFGGGDPEQAQAALARLFEADANIFSHQLAVAVIVGGQPVGMLVSGPWEVMQRLQVPTAFAIGRTSGMAALVRLAIRSLPLMGAPEAERGEYFVSHTAVLPGFRRRGLGTLLMRHAETRASHAGLRRLALTVAVDNAPAISLYERLGFEIVGASKFPSLEHRIGYPGFFRMRKAIS